MQVDVDASRCFVAKVDFKEIFAPIRKFRTIRCMLAIRTEKDLEIY